MFGKKKRRKKMKVCAGKLYKVVAKKTGFDVNNLGIALRVFLSEILEAIKRGEDVHIKGFGRFLITSRPGHYQEVIGGWDKKTNKPIRKKMYCRPKKKVRFRQMKYFKEVVAELNVRDYGDQAFNTKERKRIGQKR